VKDDPCTNEAVLNEQATICGDKTRIGKWIIRYWAEAVVVAIALLLWAPRLSGPIDLRWDAGVYYVLGTSLATGHGYRILSEPGSPEALQYPPLLPAVVALYQRALGSTDPAVVAPWLRISYAALFLAYAVAVLALARRYLHPGLAVAVTALCLFHAWTIFLSDLLFAEVPFALVSVGFVLVAVNGPLSSRPWLREAASFVLAVGGFLLRTAGVVLLAAWVLDALARGRWRQALMRGALALLPVVAWQAHVAQVHKSYEYAHPAYEYQRAPYQYSNVSYGENVLLIDPFRPELGRVDARALATRLEKNLPSLVTAIGEAVSTRSDWWSRLLLESQRNIIGRPLVSNNVVLVPVFGLAAIVLAGVVVLIRRRAWLIVFIVTGSIGLVWAAPWYAQFTRYLTPLMPFLAICAALSLSEIELSLRARQARWPTTLARIAIASFLVLAFVAEVYTSFKVTQLRNASKEALVTPQSRSAGYRLFFHDRSWQAWEEAAAWIDAHAPSDAIVATTEPHFLYLLTGRFAVIPPMEPDPTRARRLLEAVPVSYVIIDELKFLDMSRRYARPAVEGDPLGWHLVHSVNGTQIYERTTSGK
jgi:hypothetical protein